MYIHKSAMYIIDTNGHIVLLDSSVVSSDHLYYTTLWYQLYGISWDTPDQSEMIRQITKNEN